MMVERSVGGEVELNYAPSGLIWLPGSERARALGLREGKIDLTSTGKEPTIAPWVKNLHRNVRNWRDLSS
jgi:hypothetical protein